ncbi:MFS general substrate transporter [Aspergillus sclerotioniger CBS 115572]|uniref:MFS general substrate transporter n=1 Tax=Aspergillus sclerotioniger CBS 115572 TaxID=1450535 RepID=A0A317WPC8_9EURO|nr:MFS general substrate transporter [Aspergillus sclerotioniger CBS 115572]PWY87875.1 MFS general substrate transporter [Aspergillus sclerotioniger CBS 115572]
MSGVESTPQDGEPSSTTPLLGDDQPPKKDISNIRALVICAAFIFIVDFASELQFAPTNQLLELSVCRSYYRSLDPSNIAPDGTILGKTCKIDVIQREVAMLRGWLGLAQALPGLLLAIPYGLLAQRYGRKLVAALGLSGEILASLWIWLACHYTPRFSSWAIAISAIIRFIGGGSSVMSSMVFALVSSFASSHSRTRVFFYMAVSQMVADLLSPPLSSLLLSRYGPDIPYLMGTPLEMVGYLGIYILPNPDPPSDGNSNESDKSEAQPPRARKATHPKEVFSYLLSPTGLLPLLLAFMVHKLSRQIEELIVQYTTVRFGWTVAQSGYLLSLSAAMHIILACAILPWTHRFLLTIYARNNAASADLLLAKGSVVFLAAGPLIMGLASHPGMLVLGLMLFIMGTGFRQSVQSYLTGAVPPENITLLYTSITVLDALGSLAAAPLLAYTLAAGIQAGGMAMGLPFLLAAGLYTVSGVGVWRVR